MDEPTQKQQILQDLRKFFLSRTSIVYVLSDEEDWVEGLLKEVSSMLQPKPKLFIWNPFQGLAEDHAGIENSIHPLEALDKVIERTDQAIYLFEGIHSFLKTNPLVSRKLKDLHRALRNRYSTVFIVAPYLVVPEDLHRDMIVYELPMSDANEVERTLMGVVSGSPHASQLMESLTPKFRDQLVKVTEGFNGAEIEQAVNGAMIEAFDSERPLNEQDIVIAAGNIVPLAITMREEIGRIERWAYNRAIPASK